MQARGEGEYLPSHLLLARPPLTHLSLFPGSPGAVDGTHVCLILIQGEVSQPAGLRCSPGHRRRQGPFPAGADAADALSLCCPSVLGTLASLPPSRCCAEFWGRLLHHSQVVTVLSRGAPCGQDRGLVTALGARPLRDLRSPEAVSGVCLIAPRPPATCPPWATCFFLCP